MKNKITKETIPEGFSLKLAFVDLIPVLFFGAAMIVFGLLFKSPLFLAELSSRSFLDLSKSSGR